MTRLTFTEEELLASHDYATPQVEAGHLLHGGFDANGRYLPPRTLHRMDAIEAWTDALRARGGDWLAADSSLLAGIRYPSVAQQKFLLQQGLGQSFWNTLTITGKIEARGRILADMVFPDLQDIVVEDISAMAIGHLNKGLLKAHGLDEGGEPAAGIGGHDIMWFALRDLAFGDVGFPDVDPLDNIARDEDDSVTAPPLPEGVTRLIYFLCNLLLIEFRAERGFATTEALLRDPDLFPERRAEAELAAVIVDRIRQDEAVHVASLRLYLGELRTCTFRTNDGREIPGKDVIDPFWNTIVHWATEEQPKLQADQQRKIFEERILAHPEGSRLLREFDALEETEYDGAQAS